MKVYELMKQLSEYPAGADVFVGQGDSERTHLESVGEGGDSECVVLTAVAVPVEE